MVSRVCCHDGGSTVAGVLAMAYGKISCAGGVCTGPIARCGAVASYVAWLAATDTAAGTVREAWKPPTAKEATTASSTARAQLLARAVLVVIRRILRDMPMTGRGVEADLDEQPIRPDRRAG